MVDLIYDAKYNTTFMSKGKMPVKTATDITWLWIRVFLYRSSLSGWQRTWKNMWLCILADNSWLENTLSHMRKNLIRTLSAVLWTWPKTQNYEMEISHKINIHQPGTCVVVRGGTKLSTMFFRGYGHACTEETCREAMGGMGPNIPRAERRRERETAKNRKVDCE